MARLTAAELHDLFLEAAATERWLPASRQRSRQTWWPAMQGEWLAYADPTTTVRLTPSAAQVDRYYAAIALSAQLCAEDRRLVWAVAFSAVERARGPAWSRIARIMHCHRQTVRDRYMRAIVRLAMKLRAQAQAQAQAQATQSRR